jgi:predicted deacylase
VFKVSQETPASAPARNRGPFSAKQLQEANEAIRAMATKPEFNMSDTGNMQNAADLNRLTRELRNRGTKDDAAMWQVYDQIFALLRAMGGVVGEPSPTPQTGMYPGPEDIPWMRGQATEPLKRSQ